MDGIRQVPDAAFLPPESELTESFLLSGGPGGQHVNRTESGVQLRYDLARSTFLSGPVAERLCALAGRRLDDAGGILLSCKAHRSQFRNRQEVRARLAALVKAASAPPRARVATRPGPAAKRKRLEAKRRRSETKDRRRRPSDEG